jgi:signal peptidase II
MKLTGNQRLFWIAFGVFGLDQLTKQIVLRALGSTEEVDLFPGFFKLVHWQNRGAAWSLFSGMDGSSHVLAAVSVVAFAALVYFRRHFGSDTVVGQVALGLVMGGILGNLCDRIFIHHVVDFLRFYLFTRSHQEIGFPAFNVADSAICVGVGLMFIQAWIAESTPRPAKN